MKIKITLTSFLMLMFLCAYSQNDYKNQGVTEKNSIFSEEKKGPELTGSLQCIDNLSIKNAENTGKNLTKGELRLKELKAKQLAHKLKSAAATKTFMQLDSAKYMELDNGDYVDNWLATYTYDDNYNITNWTGSEWIDSNSTWLPSEKEDYTFDANSNITGYFYAEYEDSVWVGYDKEEYDYDDNGNQILFLEYNYDDTTLVYNYKYVYEYDDNNNITNYYYINWNDSVWVNSGRTDYTYDSEGVLTEYLSYSWNNSDSTWVIYGKTEYTYNSDGNVTSDIFSTCNSTDSTWTNSGKSEYTYDSDGNQIEYNYYYWSTSSDSWIHSSITEYTYDSDGNQIEYLSSYWNGSSWTNNYKYEYTYDANGNMTEYFYANWSSDAWVNQSKYTYEYNESYTLADDVITPYYYNDYYFYNMVNMPTVYYQAYWVDSTSAWQEEPSYKTSYIYTKKEVEESSSINNGVEENELAGNIYPNPCNENITVSFSSDDECAVFVLYDSQGKQLLSKTVSNTETISLSDFNSGLYFYTLSTSIETQDGKLIKQ